MIPVCAVLDDISMYILRGVRFKNKKGENQMKCMRCGKEAYKSTTSEAIDMEPGLLVIRNIPCYKCLECTEILYTGDVVKKIEGITEKVKLLMQEFTIIDFNKATEHSACSYLSY